MYVIKLIVTVEIYWNARSDHIYNVYISLHLMFRVSLSLCDSEAISYYHQITPVWQRAIIVGNISEKFCWNITRNQLDVTNGIHHVIRWITPTSLLPMKNLFFWTSKETRRGSPVDNRPSTDYLQHFVNFYIYIFVNNFNFDVL